MAIGSLLNYGRATWGSLFLPIQVRRVPSASYLVVTVTRGHSLPFHCMAANVSASCRSQHLDSRTCITSVIYALLFILEERNNCKNTTGISWKKNSEQCNNYVIQN